MLNVIVYILVILALLALIFSLSKKLIHEIEFTPRKVKSYVRLLGFYLPTISINLKTSKLSYIGKVILLCLGVRLAIYIVAWIFHMTLQGNGANYLSFWQSLDDIWIKWDAPHYLALAELGYFSPAQNPLFIVFFPLYPTLVDGVHLLINDFFSSAVIVSLVCYFSAAIVFFKLVEKETGDSETALGAVKYLSIYPYAFFYGTAYTESLFLLITVCCFWALRSGKWGLVFVCGVLAGLTRIQGMLLFVPILLEAYFQRKSFPWYQRLAALASPIIGFGGYLLLNYAIFSNPFQFRIAQRQNWHNDFGVLPQNLSNMVHSLFTDTNSMNFGIWIPSLACFIFACALLWWGRHRIALSFQAYSLIYLMFSFSPSWLISAPRYMAVLFPLAMLTAMWAQQSSFRKQMLDLFFIFCLTLAVYFFVRGWVY